MPTQLSCPGCDRNLAVEEDATANYPKCPACGGVVPVQGSVLWVDKVRPPARQGAPPPARAKAEGSGA